MLKLLNFKLWSSTHANIYLYMWMYILLVLLGCWFWIHMATSAFKSTTKRTPIGASSSSAEDSGSSNQSSAHRRSRSLSRFSHRIPVPGSDDFDDGVPAPRGKFVNTVRGSGFPEISLDDLAIEFFHSGDRGRSGSRSSEAGPASGPGASSSSSSSLRRGRSVSRQSSKAGVDGRSSVCNSSGGGRVVSESNSRRRRSVSVVRCQISDSEVRFRFAFLVLY